MYYKRNGVVVKSNVAPVEDAGQGIIAIVDGWQIPFTKLDPNVTPQGLIIQQGEKWDEASEVEYLTYRSVQLNIDSYLSRDIKAKLWALNNSDSHELRLGVNYPGDKKPVNIRSLEDKFSIITLTQHFHADDLPDFDKVSNSKLVNWIITKRKSEPFIYIAQL